MSRRRLQDIIIRCKPAGKKTQKKKEEGIRVRERNGEGRKKREKCKPIERGQQKGGRERQKQKGCGNI